MAQEKHCADGAHEWSAWGPAVAGSQAMARICYRCGKFERNDVVDASVALPKEGTASYRNFVGPQDRYDIVSAMTFNLLTTLGLRQHHRVLDIGCGSLRNARLLIPYLDPGNYTGFEPNRWLVEEGMRHETGADLIAIKKPRFFHSTSPDALDPTLHFDYAFAQAIFIHSPLSLVRAWVGKAGQCVENNGVLLASFHVGDKDYEGEGWVYPGHVYFRMETMREEAARAGFRFQALSWRHPSGLAWGVFAKPDFDTSWFTDETLTWNRKVDADAAYRIWPAGTPWV
jgi:SAM-dependent methyltransferase